MVKSCQSCSPCTAMRNKVTRRLQRSKVIGHLLFETGATCAVTWSMSHSCHCVSPWKHSTLLLRNQALNKFSTAFRAPFAQQILANGRSAEMPDVGISIIVIAVSLTGFRYSYQQEYVSWWTGNRHILILKPVQKISDFSNRSGNKASSYN